MNHLKYFVVTLLLFGCNNVSSVQGNDVWHDVSIALQCEHIINSTYTPREVFPGGLPDFQGLEQCPEMARMSVNNELSDVLFAQLAYHIGTRYQDTKRRDAMFDAGRCAHTRAFNEEHYRYEQYVNTLLRTIHALRKQHCIEYQERIEHTDIWDFPR